MGGGTGTGFVIVASCFSVKFPHNERIGQDYRGKTLDITYRGREGNFYFGETLLHGSEREVAERQFRALHQYD